MTKPIEDSTNAAAIRTALGVPTTAALDAKYTKPSGGIPATDLDADPAGRVLLTATSTSERKQVLGLDQVNNTSDANKPISTAQQTALDAKMAATLPAMQAVFDAGTAPQKAAFQSSVSGDWNKGLKARFINVHDLRLTEPMQQLDLPSPYSSTFAGLTNREHAYGTPIFFPNGWRGYRYWMIGAPYPTTVKGACTISQATPGVVTYASHPFQPGMPISFSTTGGLPTGLTAGSLYFVANDANFSTNTFAVAASPGGAAINTTSAGSGTHTVTIYAAKYENPTLYVSNDGENFIPAPNARAPLFDCFSITSGSDLGSYYADPYIAYDPTGDKLFVLWCWFARSGTTKCSLLISESSDGATWSAPVEIASSTSTTFTPNSPSLIRTATGWSIIALDTRDATGTFTIIVSTTTSATPYTGWTAPGAVFSGNWTAATYTHPLGRQLWHMFIIGLADGGFVGLAADNNSAGGTAYTLSSVDGLTWSVLPFSAWNSAAGGGSWYRPGLCVCNDGANLNLIAYISRVSPLQTFAARGFYMQRARVTEGYTQDVLTRQMLRDSVHRNLAAPVALKAAGILAWDSFNRADSALTLGNAESGQTWAYNSANVFGTSTNRAYITGTGNSIAVLDVASQNYDVEVTLQTLGTQFWLLWNYQDATNFWRFGYTGTASNVQKVVAGTPTTWGANITFAAGDVLRVSKRGARATLFHNDRPIDSYYDSTFAALTKCGVQAAGASPTYFENFIVRAG